MATKKKTVVKKNFKKPVRKSAKGGSASGRKPAKSTVKKSPKKTIKPATSARGGSALGRKKAVVADALKQKADGLVMKGRQRGFVTYTEILKVFPNVETDILFLEELYGKLEDAGVDVLELGIPFSDPLADGPVIQRSSECALAGGTTLESTLDMVASVLAEDGSPYGLIIIKDILSYLSKKHKKS